MTISHGSYASIGGCCTSPNLHYERLGADQFALIVAESHPWAGRRAVPVSELHGQRLLQLTDSFVMRRMSDAICRQHRVRPRTVAEINAIGMLLRSLEALQAAALMPTITLREREALKLKAIRLQGKDFAVEIGLLRLIDSENSGAIGAFTALAKATAPRMIKG